MALKVFIGGLAAGAGLVYLLDPERGPTRRQQLSERLRPLVDGAARVLERGAASVVPPSPGYGSRIGDLEGLGDATLRSQPRDAPGARAGGSTALQVAGGLLALYLLTRGGKGAALLKTLGAGFLVSSTGRAKLGMSGIGP